MPVQILVVKNRITRIRYMSWQLRLSFQSNIALGRFVILATFGYTSLHQNDDCVLHEGDFCIQ